MLKRLNENDKYTHHGEALYDNDAIAEEVKNAHREIRQAGGKPEMNGWTLRSTNKGVFLVVEFANAIGELDWWEAEL